ncbi:MAG TPA: MerR family DNA-binding protein [Terracidiphilus sp.]|jgi:DNA-binding transcriptional MerR regulator|nr:MerR family DNA-binding protein [Terracidiphilus sp.]
MGAFLQIGAVADETGLTADTIRFYERERLLHRAMRSSGGFRLFSRSDVADLDFIRNAQELGFSLEEIRDLLILRNTRRSDCGQMEKILQNKISSVREKIASLRKLEHELEQTMIRCQANLRKAEQGKGEDCPAMSEISRGKDRRRR